MEAQFWHGRWVDNEIGWHQDKINPDLKKFWTAIAGDAKGTVLVPLCGKSADMVWLGERGHLVVGVELSEVAIESFFHENGLDAVWQDANGMRFMQAGRFRIFCGDFFEVRRELLGPIDFVYDRAALIALSAKEREDYGVHLGSLVVSGARGLLLTVDYDQSLRSGPPFSVSHQEVEQNFGEHFEIEMLGQSEIIDEKPKYREWGLESLTERRYLLQSKAK